MTTDSAIQDVVFSEGAIHERVRELGREISSCLLYTSDAADE